MRICHGLAFVPVCALALAACSGSGPTAIPSGVAKFQLNALRAPSSQNSVVNVYALGDGKANATAVADMRVGADGKLYYSTVAPYLATSGEIGAFDFTSHAQRYEQTSYVPSFIDQTPHAVWVEEARNGSGSAYIDRYTSIGGTDMPVAIPIPAQQNGMSGGLAVGADGQMWWGARNESFGEINQTTNAVTVYNLPNQTWITDMVLGSDSHIWLADNYLGGVYRIVSGGPDKGARSFAKDPQGNGNYADLGSIVSADNGRIYLSVQDLYDGNAFFDEGRETASPAFEAITMPTWANYRMAAAPGKIYYAEYSHGSVGIFDTSTRSTVLLPLPVYADGNGIALDAQGNAWLSCQTTNQQTYQTSACIEQVVLRKTWQVYPATTVTIYRKGSYGVILGPGILGIGETGDSGPFTAASSDRSICRTSIVKGFGHDVLVNPIADGKCTVTITDAHARSVSVNVTVANRGYRQP